MNKSIFIFTFLLIAGITLSFAKDNVDIESLTYLELKADVYKPVNISGKVPAVFFAHNGYGKKEDWGSFPKDLANEGYMTVSIGWEDFSTVSDVYKAIDLICKKYDSIIDTDKIAFVGGCHGAVKLLTLLDNKDLLKKINIKTAVAISISEEDQNMIDATKKHPIPILAIYAKSDKYGYSAINKKFADELLGEPKKVLALDVTPHGNEMLVDSGTKPVVSKEIIDWLRKYVR